MNVVDEFSNILKHFLYSDSAVLETYQSQLIEFFAIGVSIVIAFLFIRFILRIFTRF